MEYTDIVNGAENCYESVGNVCYEFLQKLASQDLKYAFYDMGGWIKSVEFDENGDIVIRSRSKNVQDKYADELTPSELFDIVIELMG